MQQDQTLSEQDRNSLVRVLAAWDPLVRLEPESDDVSLEIAATLTTWTLPDRLEITDPKQNPDQLVSRQPLYVHLIRLTTTDAAPVRSGILSTVSTMDAESDWKPVALRLESDAQADRRNLNDALAALTDAAAAGAKAEDKSELRWLSSPGQYFTALWLVRRSPDGSLSHLVSPVNSFRLRAGEAYRWERAVEILYHTQQTQISTERGKLPPALPN